MKNPFFRWLVTQATTIVPTTPAAANGVRNPTSSSAPDPISVRLASQAWTTPGFIPRLSNHRAVPGILPPRKTWLIPCARKTTPSATRRTSSERLAAVVSGMAVILSGVTGSSWRTGPGGVPVLDGVKGWVAGPVLGRFDAGDHVAFLVAAESGAAGRPDPDDQLGFQAVKDLEPGHEA